MRIETHVFRHGIVNFFTKEHTYQLKCPWNKPLFSERFGYESPLMSVFGFRLFRTKPFWQIIQVPGIAPPREESQ